MLKCPFCEYCYCETSDNIGFLYNLQKILPKIIEDEKENLRIEYIISILDMYIERQTKYQSKQF